MNKALLDALEAGAEIHYIPKYGTLEIFEKGRKSDLKITKEEYDALLREGKIEQTDSLIKCPKCGRWLSENNISAWIRHNSIFHPLIKRSSNVKANFPKNFPKC